MIYLPLILQGTKEEAIEKMARAKHDPLVRYFDEQKHLARLEITGLEAIGLVKFSNEK